MRYSILAAALAAPALAAVNGGVDVHAPVVNEAKAGLSLGKRHGTPTRRHLAQVSGAAGVDVDLLGLDIEAGGAVDADVLRRDLTDVPADVLKKAIELTQKIQTKRDLPTVAGASLDKPLTETVGTLLPPGSVPAVVGEVVAALKKRDLPSVAGLTLDKPLVDTVGTLLPPGSVPALVGEVAAALRKRGLVDVATGLEGSLKTPLGGGDAVAGLDLGLGKRTDDSCPLAPVLDTAKSTIEPLVEQVKAALNECTDGSLDQKLHDDIEAALTAIVKAVEDLLAAVLGLVPASKRSVDVLKQAKRNGAGDDSCQQEVASTLADILNEVICLLNEVETKVSDLHLPIVGGLLDAIFGQLNGPLGQVLQLVQTILPGVLAPVCQILAGITTAAGPVLSLLTGLLGSLPGLNILTGILSGLGLGNLLGAL